MTHVVLDKEGKAAHVGDKVVFVSGNYADLHLYIGHIKHISPEGVLISPKSSYRQAGMFLIIGGQDE